ncbi:MAG TPA: phosphoribosyltransferase family protein [Polyangiaceae bacterium]
MTTLLRHLVDTLLSILAPSTCSACGEPESERVFCAPCGEPDRAARREIDGVPVLAAGRYAPPLSNAIRRFKFEGHPELARSLARLVLAEVAALSLERRDAWVPVPLHRARVVERGFNQSALLALALAKATGTRFAPRALERRRRTDQQARLEREGRAHNVHGAFTLRRAVAGGRVVLVDDVVTTGATVRACLDAFRAANVRVLAVVALAVAPA